MVEELGLFSTGQVRTMWDNVDKIRRSKDKVGQCQTNQDLIRQDKL